MKFDELFTLELGVAFRKHRVEAEQAGVAHTVSGSLTERLSRRCRSSRPGRRGERSTRSAKRWGDPAPMNVLLQGDVGAGKTLVALHAALVAIQSGHQAAIMAPTEVLAGQHLRSVAALLDGVGAMAFLDLARAWANGRRPGDPLGPRAGVHAADASVTYALLTGAVTGKDRTRIVEGIADGAIDLTIGTHALVQEGVSFRDLSLAVIDEQHRFGLHQRMALKGKGVEPDVLIMTATPIPRTLALTYYGDLDVIVLDEMPKGRQPIETRAVRTPEDRDGPTTWCVARSRQGGRRSWCARRSTKGTARR